MSEDRAESELPAPQGEGSGPRRPYAKPRLVDYGSVSKLTQGTMTKQADLTGGGFRRACL